MPIYRILLFSKAQIHGVRLRELVKKIADASNPKIHGWVKNENDEHQVEIVCNVEDISKKKFIESIRNLAKKELNIDIENEEPILANDLQKWVVFNEFKIIRDNEIKEIDLAIRGAERIFRDLECRISGFIKTRENEKIEGLKYGLKKIRESLMFEEPTGIYKPAKTIALDNFLGEPFDEGLFNTCQELDQSLDRLKDYSGKVTSDKSAIEETLELINTATKEIDEFQRRNGYENIINELKK